ncbi:MAG: hypothetical protein KAT57_12230, partial [Candidatus Lokiarchaeota archaeon]|nr:hypothetical protein [Candidatus Lokiarchaeota archaeon]
MFIYLENLDISKDKEREIFLIPQPRYFKFKNIKKSKITEQSILLTDLEGDYSFIIEQFQEKLVFFGLKKGIEVQNVDDTNKYPQIESFLKNNIKIFPDQLYNK